MDKNLYIVNPDTPDDLTFTKIINGNLGSTKITNWINAIKEIHKFAFQYYGTYEKLKTITKSNIKHGKYTKNGFHYISDLNISIQGENANTTWRNTLYIAKRLRIPIEIIFEWRDEDKAAYPGKKGKILWYP